MKDLNELTTNERLYYVAFLLLIVELIKWLF